MCILEIYIDKNKITICFIFEIISVCNIHIEF